MTLEKRLGALEERLGGTRELPTFEIVTAPEGLTAEEHQAWSEADRRDAEARGVVWFTMDLGPADVR